jgi:hypothetical protein
MDDRSTAPTPATPLDDTTRQAEAGEAMKEHDAGREPTPEEEAAAERSAHLSDAAAVEEHEREMQELGAETRGEGSPG